MPHKWGIYGPEKHRRKWRVRVCPPDGPSRSRGFDTREEAQAYRDQVEADIERSDAQYRAAKLYAEAEAALAEAQAVEGQKRTVSEAVDLYELYLREERGLRHETVATAVHRVNGLLEPLMSMNVARVTLRAAKDAYRARVASGKSAATHRGELKEVRRMWRALMEEHWAATNPWGDVKPVGRVSKGKEQLRDHEAEVLGRVALRQARGVDIGDDHWADNRRLGALAVLVALLLGPRPKEVVSLTVRDVGPKILYVNGTKTDNARRRVRIPKVLAPLLSEHASQCEARGQERLFPFTRDWVRRAVQRLCGEAGLPRVCAQALRGMHATLATEAGMTGLAVARQLGHGSDAVTHAHYIDPEAAEDARNRRVQDELASQEGQEPDEPASNDGQETDPPEADSVGRENGDFLDPRGVKNTPEDENPE